MEAPIVLRPEEVPEDLICSICLTLPVEPILTPCEHIFCKDCIHQALHRRCQCPVDRIPCHQTQIVPLRGMLYRIWSGVVVKCGNHAEGCAWTGSIGDYPKHAKCCRGHCRVNVPTTAIIEQWIEQAVAYRLQHARIENMQLRRQLDIQTQCVQQYQAQFAATMNAPHLCYDYSRGSAVQMSQLISRFLENKPPTIDAARVFDRVRFCYSDARWKSANPVIYKLDVGMLLATCAASTWFTDSQSKDIEKWLAELFR